MKNMSNILCGLLFIIVGIIWGINSLGIASINIFFDGWWTLFIIIPSVLGIVKRPKDSINYVGLIIGTLFLLCAREILSFELILKLIFPVIFVGIGVNIIFKDRVNTKVEKKMQGINQDCMEIYSATFSENKIRLQADEFKNACLDASFGSIKFDISDCEINEDKVIKASAIFSGIDIKVPKNVNVKVKSSNIFGGTSNKTKNKVSDAKFTIYIDSLALFGGVEIE